MKIGYSGIKGAYADIAAGKIFEGAQTLPYPSFGSVYEAVERGSCDYGVLPIENSFAGDVAQVLDLLYFGKLYIAGVYEMPIVHHLMGVQSAELGDIRRVCSHPQALDQCRAYISGHGFEELVATNTAVSARNVAESGDKTLAAIASRETADIYGLKILEGSINESDDNMTKFIVISRKDSPLDDKREAFSMIFTVKNEAGALAKAVVTIGIFGFNMRAIRSRPAKGLAWNYYFYIEGDGDLSSENGRNMILALGAACENVRVLGNYASEKILGGR